uniref:Retrotransposon protein n=1 Tax=Caenorhabditis tropicalis TaxID=1561998 RepID=A0A1I7T432_9PELO
MAFSKEGERDNQRQETTTAMDFNAEKWTRRRKNRLKSNVEGEYQKDFNGIGCRKVKKRTNELMKAIDGKELWRVHGMSVEQEYMEEANKTADFIKFVMAKCLATDVIVDATSSRVGKLI